METQLTFLEQITHNEWLAQVVFGAIIVLATAVIAHLCTKFLRHMLNAREALPNTSIFVNLIRGIIWIIGLSIMLDVCFKVNVGAVVTALGVVGIAVSLGFQDTLSNLIGGLQVSVMGLIRPGDHVRIGSDTGVVQDITWRHTDIKNRFGETIVIPNAIINKNAVTILPAAEATRIDFMVTNSGQNLDELANRLRDVCAEATAAITPLHSVPVVSFLEVTEYGFRGKIIVEIEDVDKKNQVIDACVRAIAPLTRLEAE